MCIKGRYCVWEITRLVAVRGGNSFKSTHRVSVLGPRLLPDVLSSRDCDAFYDSPWRSLVPITSIRRSQPSISIDVWGPGPPSPMASNPASGAPQNVSASAKPPANGWTRRDRPCDACRRRKSRCITLENTETCIMCQSRAEECTFVENPQRRKRRRIEDESSDASKPRLAAQSFFAESYC